MPRDECLRLEQALASESDIDEQLRGHAEACPRCAMLIEISRLAAPTVTAEDDELARSIAQTAATIAYPRAMRWERRRRLVPLVIGAAGWLLGAVLVTYGLLSGGASSLIASGGRALPSFPSPDSVMIPALSVNPRVIVTVLLAAATWLSILWLVNARRQVTAVETRET